MVLTIDEIDAEDIERLIQGEGDITNGSNLFQNAAAKFLVNVGAVKYQDRSIVNTMEIRCPPVSEFMGSIPICTPETTSEYSYIRDMCAELRNDFNDLCTVRDSTITQQNVYSLESIVEEEFEFDESMLQDLEAEFNEVMNNEFEDNKATWDEMVDKYMAEAEELDFDAIEFSPRMRNEIRSTQMLRSLNSIRQNLLMYNRVLVDTVGLNKATISQANFGNIVAGILANQEHVSQLVQAMDTRVEVHLKETQIGFADYWNALTDSFGTILGVFFSVPALLLGALVVGIVVFYFVFLKRS